MCFSPCRSIVLPADTESSRGDILPPNHLFILYYLIFIIIKQNFRGAAHTQGDQDVESL